MKKIIGFILAVAIVSSCFAGTVSAEIVDGESPDGIFEVNDAFSGLIDGDGPIIEEDDDFDDTIAQPVIEMIAALGTIDLNKESDVKAAREAFNALTEKQRAFVTNINVLEAAEDRIEELKQEVIDKAAAAEVDAAIEALGTIDLNKEDAVKAARTAYDALTAAQKAFVEKLEVLEAAEDRIEELKQEAIDKAAAAAVDAEIEALGTIDLSKKAAVEAARDSYDDLTAAQKAFVEKLSALEAAEARIAELEEDAAAVQNVIGLIDALPDADDITESNRAQVEAARAAYDALDTDLKALVTNYADLEAAEEALDIMKGDLDNNKTINVSDVVALRQVIMKKNATDYQLKAGDMDNNGSLNVSDVVALRQLIMNKQA